jgi:hypothetical protein
VATPRAAAPSQCGLRGELRGGSGVASGKVWGGGGSPCGEATARGGGNDGRQHSTAASGLRWLATSVGRSCSMRPTIGVRRGGKNQHGQGPGMKLTEGQGRGGGGGLAAAVAPLLVALGVGSDGGADQRQGGEEGIMRVQFGRGKLAQGNRAATRHSAFKGTAAVEEMVGGGGLGLGTTTQRQGRRGGGDSGRLAMTQERQAWADMRRGWHDGLEQGRRRLTCGPDPQCRV